MRYLLALLSIAALSSTSLAANPEWFEKKDNPIDTYIASINNIIKAEKQAGNSIPAYRNTDKVPMFVFPEATRFSPSAVFKINVSGVQKLYLGSADSMRVSSLRLDKGDGTELTIRNKDKKVIVGFQEQGKQKVGWHGGDTLHINGAELTLELNKEYKWISGTINASTIAWIDTSSHHDKWKDARRNRELARSRARIYGNTIMPAGYTSIDFKTVTSTMANHLKARQEKEKIDPAFIDIILKRFSNAKTGADYIKAVEMMPAVDQYQAFKRLRDNVAAVKAVPGLLKRFDETDKLVYYQMDPKKFDYNNHNGVRALDKKWSGIIKAINSSVNYPAEIIKSIDSRIKTESDAATAKRELERLSARLTAASGDLDNFNSVVKELETFHLSLYSNMDEFNFDALLINRNPPPIPAAPSFGSQHLGRYSRIGKGLGILTGWKDGKPVVKNILEGKMPPGAYRSPDLSYDAKRVVFAFCDHTVENPKHRRYFIYEAAIDGSWVRQLTGTKRDKLATWDNRATAIVEDNDPCYLPDGDLIFISSRCQSFGRCFSPSYIPAKTLYRCDKDGNNIRQLSFGNENEYEPSVLNDGRIAFTRWEYTNRSEINFHKLWWCRPDGTAVTHFFGNDMPSPHQFNQVSAIPGSHKVVATATGHHSQNTGTTVVIDTNIDENGEHAITHITPETPYYESGGTANRWVVRSDRQVHYSHPYALNENLFLASRANYPQVGTRVADRGIYLVCTDGARIRIYEDPEVATFAPIPIRERKVPPVLPSMVKKDAEPYGTLFLQNAYLTRNDPKGLIKPGMIKAIRVNAIGVQPSNGRPKCSPTMTVNVDIPKKVLGTVPVNEDGSAAFKVPANVSLQVQILDENGMAIMTEKSFFYMQPGEKRSCIGCHEPVGSTPDMKKAAKMARMKPVDLKPAAGPQYRGGMSFARTVQPVLDRHCIKCHGLEKTEGKVNLIYKDKSKRGGYPKSLQEIVKRGKHGIGGKGVSNSKYKEYKVSQNISRPFKFFAYENKVAHMLAKGDKNHKKLKDVDHESYMRIIEWLDLNGQCYGDLFPNKIEDRKFDSEGLTALRSYAKELFGDEIAKQPEATLVNLSQPDESRILLMPLPEDKGGWGQIKGYSSKDDEKYKKMAELVEACVTRLPNENTNGWQPTLLMGAGVKWVMQARSNYLEKVRQPAEK